MYKKILGILRLRRVYNIFGFFLSSLEVEVGEDSPKESTKIKCALWVGF